MRSSMDVLRLNIIPVSPRLVGMDTIQVYPRVNLASSSSAMRISSGEEAAAVQACAMPMAVETYAAPMALPDIDISIRKLLNAIGLAKNIYK